MNQKIKRLWVKALRSGKYKQARGTLRQPNGGAMCCLGVLCDIQGIEWDKSAFSTAEDLKTEDLPRQFNAGLRKSQRLTLAALNDGVDCHMQHNFKKIADYIARNL